MFEEYYGKGAGIKQNSINFVIGKMGISSTKAIDNLHAGFLMVKRRVESPINLLNELGDIVMQGLYENLQSAGDGTWEPLKEKTIKSRIRKGQWPQGAITSQPILNASGEMFEAITVFNSGKTIEVGISENSLETLKMWVHQMGSSIMNIPSRPLLYLSPHTQGTLYQVLAEMLENLLQTDPHRHAARAKRSRLYARFEGVPF